MSHTLAVAVKLLAQVAKTNPASLVTPDNIGGNMVWTLLRGESMTPEVVHVAHIFESIGKRAVQFHAMDRDAMNYCVDYI